MNIETWMKRNPNLVYETLGDLSVSALANRIENDKDLGAYLYQQLKERYDYEMACRNIPREPDTELQAEARAINDENRRAVG